MQIVIDIPEEDYKGICHLKNEQLQMLPEEVAETLIRIANGTPLPKGHGALKDEDEICKKIEDRVEFLRSNDPIFMRLRKDIDILGCIPKIRTEVPTLIEADKESEG